MRGEKKDECQIYSIIIAPNRNYVIISVSRLCINICAITVLCNYCKTVLL